MAQKETSNDRNEFHLVGNLWGYGAGEMTYNCHISREVLFQAWNSVVIDKTSQSMEMKFNARLKKGMDILLIDFQSLSNIVKDDSEEQYLFFSCASSRIPHLAAQCHSGKIPCLTAHCQ